MHDAAQGGTGTGAEEGGGEATVILALDPGFNLGAAWVRPDGSLERLALLRAEDADRVELPARGPVLVGDGTGSGELVARLRARGATPLVVDERDTTLIARELYFRDHPPRGLQRLLPPGLRSPPRNLDDYAAYAIALRWLERRR